MIANFIPQSTWQGAKDGYAFKRGERGLGYYLEHVDRVEVSEQVYGKRPSSAISDTSGWIAQKNGNSKTSNVIASDDVALEDLDEATIARMLEEADRAQVAELDVHGLRQLLMTLEKRININQRLRIKYADDPGKFVDSEVDLDEALKSLAVVSAAPELYPKLVELGAVTSLLGLLTHENTDISISAITLLQDITDAEVLSEREEALCIVDSIVDAHGLPLLIQNVSRLDESVEEDAKGINATMGVLENLLEVRPSLGPQLCLDTEILGWLLKRVRSKAFDENKLYASELLNMLANSDTEIQQILGTYPDLEGVDQLLQACAQYRRKDPVSPEEEECIENLFGTLAATQLVSENQKRFRLGEGFELMIRCVREKKYAAVCAIKVIDYAMTNNATNCEHMVESGGLKAVFPVFMGRAAARKLRKIKKLSKGDANNLLEHCISIIASLALHLEDRPSHDCLSRFVSKFFEDGMEKVDRVVELYVDFAAQVTKYESNVASKSEAYDEDGYIELDALAAGGFALQRLAVTMAVVAAYSSSLASRFEVKLRQLGMSLSGVRAVIEAYANRLGDDSAAEVLRAKLLALMPVEEEGDQVPSSNPTRASKEDTLGENSRDRGHHSKRE